MDKPDRIVVTMDGRDAQIFQKLVRILGSETRAQELVLLEGYLAKMKSAQIPIDEIRRIEALWPKILGISGEEIERRISQI